MTERSREWMGEWLKPSIIIQFILFILLCGGFYASFHALEREVASLHSTMAELQKSQNVASMDLLKASGDSKVELVRYQEEIKALGDRLQLVEKFVVDQNQINTGLFTRLAKVGG